MRPRASSAIVRAHPRRQSAGGLGESADARRSRAVRGSLARRRRSAERRAWQPRSGGDHGGWRRALAGPRRRGGENAGRAREGAARSANAQRFAPSPYAAAMAAERDAQRLYDGGRPGDATVKFYEASGLFRSAEIAAQNETTARDAARAQQRRSPEQAERPAAAEPRPSGPRRDATAGDRRRRHDRIEAGSRTAHGPASVALPPPPAPSHQRRRQRLLQPAAPKHRQPRRIRRLAVARVAGRYKAALEARNLDALKRVWPGLSGAQDAIRDEFRHARQHRRRYHRCRRSPCQAPQERSASSGATKWSRSRDNGSRASSRERRWTFVAMGPDWVIERIRFESGTVASRVYIFRQRTDTCQELPRRCASCWLSVDPARRPPNTPSIARDTVRGCLRSERPGAEQRRRPARWQRTTAAHFNSAFQSDFRLVNIALTSQLTAVPLPSPASGFTYKFDSATGTFVRSTTSFGPILSDRAETIGRGRAGVRIHATSFSRSIISTACH